VISVQAVDVTNNETIPDLLWPTPDVLEQAELFNDSISLVSIVIPGDLIQRRGKG